MLEILSTLFTAWCIYVVWKWLFPGKDGRARRRELKRQQKLGMIFPSEYPRNDSFVLKQGIDYVMGGILQWKKAKDGQLLVYKPAVRNVNASVIYLRREGEAEVGGQLPLRVYVQDIGTLVVNVPASGVIDTRRENGVLSSGDELLFLNTKPEAIQAWKDEQARIAEEEKAKKAREAEQESERRMAEYRAREARYQEFLAEEKRKQESLEYKIEQAERMKAAAEREKAEIAAKLKEQQRRRELEKQVRQDLIDSGELFGDQTKRPRIPREVVDAVYKRDGGRCQECGTTEDLQLDHIIPFSKGGATTVENLQLLCGKCNRAKSNKIG
jgi:hypothetical protein